MSGRQAGASRSGRPGKVAPASDGDGRRGGRRAALGPPAVTGSRDGDPRVHAAELSTALAGEPRTTRGFWVSPRVVPPPRQTMWCGRSRPVLLGARAGTGREAGCVTPAAGGTTTEQPRTAITPPGSAPTARTDSSSNPCGAGARRLRTRLSGPSVCRANGKSADFRFVGGPFRRARASTGSPGFRRRRGLTPRGVHGDRVPPPCCRHDADFLMRARACRGVTSASRRKGVVR